MIARLRALLGVPETLSRDQQHLEHTLTEARKAIEAAAAEQARTARALTQLQEATERQFRHLHLQFHQLAALVHGRPVETMGAPVPGHVEAEPPIRQTPPDDPRASSDEWLEVTVCPACRTEARTVVCEWNKLLLLEAAPDARAWRYDYALCHGCGWLYASKRPHGGRYQYLLEHFEDVIDKHVTDPLLNPHPLTDADRERYRAMFALGLLRSHHQKPAPLAGVFRDRFETAGHVDLLGSLLDLRGARVLSVRSRSGALLDGLRRHYGAEVCAMPIWESQQLIMRELFGIPTSELIDFDRFRVPFEGPFDLILCNHMLNHAVRPGEFLDAVKQALRPGGHLYLYNELDDAEYLDGSQSMIATMNPLHLQAFDQPSLIRLLAANGFEPVFMTVRKHRHLCLLRYTGEVGWTPMTPAERDARVDRYQRARDRAVLRVPEHVRPRVAAEWDGAVTRALQTGVATLDRSGAVRVAK